MRGFLVGQEGAFGEPGFHIPRAFPSQDQGFTFHAPAGLPAADFPAGISGNPAIGLPVQGRK